MNYADADHVCYRTAKIEAFFHKKNKRLNNAESSYSWNTICFMKLSKSNVLLFTKFSLSLSPSYTNSTQCECGDWITALFLILFFIHMANINNRRAGEYHLIKLQFIQKTEITRRDFIKRRINYDWLSINNISMHFYSIKRIYLCAEMRNIIFYEMCI